MTRVNRMRLVCSGLASVTNVRGDHTQLPAEASAPKISEQREHDENDHDDPDQVHYIASYYVRQWRERPSHATRQSRRRTALLLVRREPGPQLGPALTEVEQCRADDLGRRRTANVEFEARHGGPTLLDDASTRKPRLSNLPNRPAQVAQPARGQISALTGRWARA